MATQWARDTAVMHQGSVTMMYGHRLCNRHRCRCSQMPSGGRQGSSLLPRPPSIGSSSSSSFSSFSSRRNCGTCIDLPDPVDPASITTPFLCMARAIRSLCDDVGRQRWAAGRVLPGMPLMAIVTHLEAMDEEFGKLLLRCFLGVSLASSPFTASPEDDVAAFVIDETALSACTRIRWGGAELWRP